MWKGVKGREAIVAFFRQEIPTGQATDLFSEFCRATKEDGSLLSDQEIADHMSFLMMAAHDTLTSSLTSLVYLLGKHPESQDKLRGEMHGLGLPPGAPLPYERLGELALLEMAFKEAMRIYPPVPGILRAAVRDAWVPFGGGAHMCLGLHFAYVQAKSFFYHLLTTTKVSLAHDYVPRWQMWPIPKPRDGLPIRIERFR
jgi:cytochrome P450